MILYRFFTHEIREINISNKSFKDGFKNALISSFPEIMLMTLFISLGVFSILKLLLIINKKQYFLYLILSIIFSFVCNILYALNKEMKYKTITKLEQLNYISELQFERYIDQLNIQELEFIQNNFTFEDTYREDCITNKKNYLLGRNIFKVHVSIQSKKTIILNSLCDSSYDNKCFWVLSCILELIFANALSKTILEDLIYLLIYFFINFCLSFINFAHKLSINETVYTVEQLKTLNKIKFIKFLEQISLLQINLIKEDVFFKSLEPYKIILIINKKNEFLNKKFKCIDIGLKHKLEILKIAFQSLNYNYILYIFVVCLFVFILSIMILAIKKISISTLVIPFYFCFSMLFIFIACFICNIYKEIKYKTITNLEQLHYISNYQFKRFINQLTLEDFDYIKEYEDFFWQENDKFAMFYEAREEAKMIKGEQKKDMEMNKSI